MSSKSIVRYLLIGLPLTFAPYFAMTAYAEWGHAALLRAAEFGATLPSPVLWTIMVVAVLLPFARAIQAWNNTDGDWFQTLQELTVGAAAFVTILFTDFGLNGGQIELSTGNATGFYLCCVIVIATFLS